MTRLERLLEDRAARWAAGVAVPPTWLALAWGEPRVLVVGLLAAAGTGAAVRRFERRRPPDDELVL